MKGRFSNQNNASQPAACPVILYKAVIARPEPDGTWWRTGGEVKGKDANGVGTLEHGLYNRRPLIRTPRLNWHPRQFKWTRPFRWKTKSGFCTWPPHSVFTLLTGWKERPLRKGVERSGPFGRPCPKIYPLHKDWSERVGNNMNCEWCTLLS